MFPSRLIDLEHLFDNQKIRFNKEQIGSEVFIIPSYMIGDSDLWNIPFACETRGHVYSEKYGVCCYASLPKFFNVNERPETQPSVIKDKISLITEKKDGSIVGVILTEEGFRVKSKKSFFSDLALEANSNLPKNVKLLTESLLKSGFTPIFEYTSPTRRIVLNYGPTPEFTLLAVRSFITGDFFSFPELQECSKYYKIPLVQVYEKTWDELLWDVENLKGIEGYVLTLTDGTLVKLKTKDYLQKHYFFTSFTERACAEMVVDETIDDIKILCKDPFDLKTIEQIEFQVVSQLTSLRKQVEEIVANTEEMSIKEFAIQFKTHPLFQLLISQKKNKEPRYKEFWKKNFLMFYSTQSLLNFGFNFKNFKKVDNVLNSM